MVVGGIASHIPSLRPHPARCKAAEKNVDSAGASLPLSRRIFAANLRTAVGHGDRLFGMAGHFARPSLRHRKGIRNPRYCIHRVVRRRRLPAWRLFDSPGALLALAAGVAPQWRHFSVWFSRCFSGRCRFRDSLPRFRLDHGRLRRPRLRLGHCHWSARLLCCRLRLRQTFQSALERNLLTNPVAAQIGGVPLGIPLHPSQLYESLYELGVFLLLMYLSRKPRRPGFLIWTFALCYSAGRFFLEFLRGDLDRGFWGPLSTSQWLSAFLLVLLLILYQLPVTHGAPASRNTSHLPPRKLVPNARN